jgi:arylsulfatase
VTGIAEEMTIMPKQTVDVLMGGYLSKDAAREDFEAVQASGAPLLGIVVVSKDLDGTLEIEQHDHIVKQGAVALGGAGFIVGLFAPPLLIATAVGAVIGAGAGKIASRKVESTLEAQAQETIPIGGAGLIVIYDHKHTETVEGAVTRPIKRVIGEATDSHVKAVKAALADAAAKMAAGSA